jgi:single-strand DNA-binding protein
MFNNITIIGYLGADPELRYTAGEGTAVCNFRIGVNRRWTGEGKDSPTDWFRVVAWRKQAEICATHLTKGAPVAVNGRLYIKEYTDKEGVQRLSHEIHLKEIVFLPNKNSAGTGSKPAGNKPAAEEYDSDDVPF